MEAAKPAIEQTPKPSIDNSKIDFIEELKIQTEKESFKIKFGIIENNLVINALPESSNNIYYYQQIYNINEFQNLSKIFSLYETIKDIIIFLKGLKFEIEEKNDDLIIKFNVFLPDGKNKLIELNLKKCLTDIQDTNQLIKYLFEEIKSIKIINKKNESEIKNLKETILNYQIEITNLKEENKKLWKEINKSEQSKQYSEESITIGKTEDILFDSKIIESMESFNFILDYFTSIPKKIFLGLIYSKY